MTKIALIATAMAAATLAAPASAVIVAGTLTGGNYASLGSFIVTTAALTPTIGLNVFNDTNVYGLDEGFAALTADTIRWTVAPLAPDVATVDLVVGTKVQSHLIFIDPASVPDPAFASGTVTFARKILGYRWRTAEFTSTNALLGASGVTYGTLRPLETTNDLISFSGNVLTYSFDSRATTGDVIRVITAVPDTATWALLVVGFGMVGVAARRRKAQVTA